MSTMPPISSMRSAPFTCCSRPARSSCASQSLRSGLATSTPFGSRQPSVVSRQLTTKCLARSGGWLLTAGSWLFAGDVLGADDLGPALVVRLHDRVEPLGRAARRLGAAVQYALGPVGRLDDRDHRLVERADDLPRRVRRRDQAVP